MKHFLIRTFLFTLLTFFGLSGPLWVFVIIGAVYLVAYTGVEMVLLAAAIDAYFGYQYDTWYMYTISVAIAVLVMQWMKPRLSLYNQ